MAAVKTTPIQLAEKYLVSLGLNNLFVKRALLPARFDENTLCKAQAEHNIVQKNKVGSGSNQTHIFITKNFWKELFSPSQINDYITVGTNNHKSKQNINIFEANVADLLARRTKKLSSSIIPASPSKKYSSSSQSIITCYTYKLFNTHSNNNQVHIGIEDDTTFKDFRLGILKSDILILFKYTNSDCLLAIAIPSEFCSSYSIEGANKLNKRASEKTIEERKEETVEDIDYSSESNDSTIKSEITPLCPTPPSKGYSRGGSSKLKYRGKASIGKGAIEKAGYLCEWDSSHESFISKTTGHPYMEPHHLIPISAQELYDQRIDITSNIICLCPTCHKMIHLGKREDVVKMLDRFLSDRKSDLSTCGIDIDINTLLAHYNL